MDPAQPEGARVLVVDDRADAATVVSAVLDAAGFVTATCGPGEEVLRALRDESVAVAVVSITDGPNGEERAASLVAELRGRPEPSVRGVGIVVLVDDSVGAASATMAGADLTIGRPLEAARLVAAVTEASSVSAEVLKNRRP